jgi:type III pantothenate kinase
MNLALDIGNTSVKYGVFEQYRLIESGYFDHFHHLDIKFYAEKLGQILTSFSIDLILIASVVPDLTERITRYLKLEYAEKYQILNKDNFKTLPIDIDNPSELGIDLIADAFGAREAYGQNTIIVDLGTATKVMAVKDGVFVGVAIAPGIISSLKGLIANTSMLNYDQIDQPQRLFGKNTKESLLSGTIYGHAALVDGLVKKGREIFTDIKGIPIIISGGYAPLITPYLKTDMIYDKLLSLKGIIRSHSDEKTNNT